MNDTVLRRAFLEGLAWNGGARWATQLITWASTMAVARRLSPEDYGLIGMATLFMGVITIAAESGICATVLTLRSLSPRQLAQLHGLAMLAGVGGCLATLAGAQLVAWFFERPSLVPVLALLAVTSLVSAPRHVPAALLQRELRFRASAIAEAAQAIVAALVTLAGAVGGIGYWALAGGLVTGQAAATISTLAVCRLPAAWPSVAGLGEALTFARQQLSGTLGWFVYSNADFAVVGRVLGARELGLYSIAWTMARVVPERFAHVVMRTTPAFLAALQHDPRAVRQWVYALTEALAVATFPLLVGLALVADDAVAVLFGAGWESAVLPLRVLAIYSAWDIVTQVLTRSLIAARDTRFTAALGMSLAVIMPAAFLIVSPWGLGGVAAAWLIVNPLVRSAIVLRARRRIGLSVRRWAAAMWPALSGTGVMAVAVVAVGRIAADHDPAVRLIGQVAAGGGVYAAALALAHHGRVAAWRTEWQRVRRTQAAPAAAADALA